VIDGEYSTQGWNRFSYCKGNPVKYKDPTGHKKNETYDNFDDNLIVNGNNEYKGREKHQYTSSGGLPEIHYTLSDKEHGEKILADTIFRRNNSTYRTVVKRNQNNNGKLEDGIEVDRYFLGVNKKKEREWVKFETFTVEEGKYKKMSAKDKKYGGNYEYIAIDRKGRGGEKVKGFNDPTIIDIALYDDPQVKGGKGTLSRIEIYDYIKGNWLGKRESSNGYNIEYGSKIPAQHDAKHWRSVEQDQFSGLDGFHEFATYNNDGTICKDPKQNSQKKKE